MKGEVCEESCDAKSSKCPKKAGRRRFQGREREGGFATGHSAGVFFFFFFLLSFYWVRGMMFEMMECRRRGCEWWWWWWCVTLGLATGGCWLLAACCLLLQHCRCKHASMPACRSGPVRPRGVRTAGLLGISNSKTATNWPKPRPWASTLPPFPPFHPPVHHHHSIRTPLNILLLGEHSAAATEAAHPSAHMFQPEALCGRWSGRISRCTPRWHSIAPHCTAKAASVP
jgi:hypothetical protein